MGKHRIVCGKGVNDLPRGWRVENELNKRIYQVWASRLQLVYDEKFHEEHPTYIDSELCLEWHWLSKFVEDIVKIEGYEYWLNNSNKRISLDKDIKSDGNNKCYCLEECMFVDIEENTRQAMVARDNDYLKGNQNALGQLIDRYDKNTGKYVDTKYQFEYVAMGFIQSAISACCKGRLKSTGGYIFKYHETEE